MSGSSKLTIENISGSYRGDNSGIGVMHVASDSFVVTGSTTLDTRGLGSESTLHVNANISGDYATKMFNDHGTAGHVLHLETDGTGAGSRLLEMEEGGGSTIFRARADGRFGFGSTGVSSMGAGTFVVGIGGGHTADIAISKRLQHLGDSDTYLDFASADRIELVAGSHNMIYMRELADVGRVYILSGNLPADAANGLTFDPNESKDIAFWVSGSAGGVNEQTYSVSAFGGDVVVSGSLTGAEPAYGMDQQLFELLSLGAEKITLGTTKTGTVVASPHYADRASDVFLYVSGSSKKHHQDETDATLAGGFGKEGVAVFGGDVMISGSLQTGVTDLTVYGGGDTYLSGTRGVTADASVASSGNKLVMPPIFTSPTGVGAGIMMTVKNQSTSAGLIISGSSMDAAIPGINTGNLFLTTGSLTGLVEQGGAQLGVYTLPAKCTATFISREGGGAWGFTGYWDVIDECEIGDISAGDENVHLIQLYASVNPSSNAMSAQYMMSTVMGSSATGDFLKDIKTYVVMPFDGEVGGITVSAWDAVTTSGWGSNMGINVYKNAGSSGNYTNPSASTMTGGGSSGFAGDSFSTKITGVTGYPDVETINVTLSSSLTFSKGDVLQFVFSPSAGSTNSMKDVIIGVEIKPG